jgi:hypothetical protein
MEAHQRRELADVELDDLPDLRLDREVDRLDAEIERAAGGGANLVGLDRDAAIDLGDAAGERQAYLRA